MPPLRIALLQQPLVWHAPAANRERLEALLLPLAGRTDLVVLPETFTTGFSMQVEQLGEPPAGATTPWLTRMARSVDAAVTGSVITVENGRYYNRLLWAEPDGTLRHYDKRHLFRMGREHQHFTAGRSAWSTQWRGWQVCPLVCYDLRFPVFSRRRPELDYELLLYVANWPAPRTAAWQQLLRARAIENLAYVAGVNRVGTDGLGVAYAGDSAVVDFLGHTLAQGGTEAAVLSAVLDGEALTAFRARFPAHLDADRFTLEP
ncbi:MAG TPA: amidohydrolase [Steroidobacteraceae bacterium]|jgi:omega-amidase|nr:amidohydrolase [Steroidobacteraceae bacterium]